MKKIYSITILIVFLLAFAKSNKAQTPTEFYVQNHTVIITSLINPNIDSLTGYGTLNVGNGNTESFYFENIELIQDGNWFYLASGNNIIFDATIPNIIMTSNNGDHIVYDPEHFKLNASSGLTINGTYNWPVHIPGIIDTSFVLGAEEYYGFNSLEVTGDSHFGEAKDINITEDGSVVYRFASNSFISFFKNDYFPRLYMRVVFKNKHSNTNNQEVSFNKNDVDEIDYLTITNTDFQDSKYFFLDENLNILFCPHMIYVDFSTEMSPPGFQDDPEWIGISFSGALNYKILDN